MHRAFWKTLTVASIPFLITGCMRTTDSGVLVHSCERAAITEHGKPLPPDDPGTPRVDICKDYDGSTWLVKAQD